VLRTGDAARLVDDGAADGAGASAGTLVVAGSLPDAWRRALAALLAVASAAGVWFTWLVFVDGARGQRVDQLAFRGATYGQGHLWQLAKPVLDVVSVSFVALGLVVAALVALLRRRWALAAQVAIMVAGANLTTQVLKQDVFTRVNHTDAWSGANTLPSGHTTVAASVSVALLLVVPRAMRSWVAVLGAAYTAATGVSTLVGQWHRPSDVVAALLVVAAWTGAVCACTPRSSLDVPRLDRLGGPRRSPGSYVAGVVLLGAAGLCGAVALGSLHDVDAAVQAMAGALWSIRRSTEVTAYIGGAFGVVAVTALVFAALLAVRQLTAVTSRPVAVSSATTTHAVPRQPA
jgi:membrane-associated phospholipid phosphatase